MSSPAALDALEQRLRPLEYLLGRSQAAGLNGTADGPPSARTSVRARLAGLEQALDDATRGSSSIERFVADYDANAALLAPAHSLTSSGSLHCDASADNLPLASKLALLLALGPELRQAAGELDQVTALVDQRKVLDRPLPTSSIGSGSGTLEALASAGKTASSQADAGSRRLAGLVEQYDGLVTDVSRTFLAFHEELQACEARLGVLERAKTGDRAST